MRRCEHGYGNEPCLSCEKIDEIKRKNPGARVCGYCGHIIVDPNWHGDLCGPCTVL